MNRIEYNIPMDHFMYNNNTIILASQLIPTEMFSLSQSQWEAYLNNNLNLAVNLVRFLADTERVKYYRNQKLDSLPGANLTWENIGGITRVSSLDAIRLNYLFTVSNLSSTVPMVYLMTLATIVVGRKTNYRVTYLGYS